MNNSLLQGLKCALPNKTPLKLEIVDVLTC